MFGPNTWDRLEVDIRYHLPVVWNHYILLLKIHWTDASSTISTSDFPCLHGVPEVFLQGEQRRCGDQWHLCCPKFVWPPRMENRKTCGSGVLNLLRHSFELTSLTAWLFFSDVFWISFSLMTFQILTELTVWVFMAQYVHLLHTSVPPNWTLYNSGFFIFQEGPCWNGLHSCSCTMTFQQDHVTQYQYAAAKIVGRKRRRLAMMMDCWMILETKNMSI